MSVLLIFDVQGRREIFQTQSEIVVRLEKNYLALDLLTDLLSLITYFKHRVEPCSARKSKQSPKEEKKIACSYPHLAHPQREAGDLLHHLLAAVHPLGMQGD